MIAIVVSRADHASTHIGEQLLEHGEWTAHEDVERPDSEGGGTYYRTDGFELREFDEIHVELGDPSKAFSSPGDLDFVVFVSRHAGETGPLLTAHFTGNFGPAEYGGQPGSFARACPGAQKAVITALSTHAPEQYEVGIECTHHGPSECLVPSMFVELGSDEPQWRDSAGAAAVARAVLDLRGVSADHEPVPTAPPRHVVGFGGGHYTPRCTRLVADSDWAVGHIGSDWQLEAMGEPATHKEVIDAVFEASRAEIAVVDGDNPALEAVIDDLDYRVVSETWLRAVGSRPLSIVSAAERQLSTVAEGLRFGTVPVGEGSETDPDAEWIEVGLPDSLIAGANGIDHEATWAAVAEATIAFETVEGATLPAGRALVAEPAAVDRLLDRLAELMASKYDAVEQTAEAVICRETGFDPQKAATLGVLEGPKFGSLAAGQAITVNGRTIKPEVVESDRTERFSVSRPEPSETSLVESDDCLTNGER